MQLCSTAADCTTVVANAWVIGGAVVLIVGTVGGFLFAARRKRPPQGLTISTTDLATLLKLVQDAGSKQTSTGGGDADAERFKQNLDYVSRHRTLIQPVPLTSDAFPEELDVLDWKPGRFIVIRCVAPVSSRVFIGLFCLPHYLIFPGLFGSFALSGLLHGFAGWLGAGAGLAFWVRNNRRGMTLKLDFRKKSYTIAHAAAFGTFPGMPRSVTLREGADGGVATLTLAVENQQLLKVPSSPQSRAKLIQFANSLLWAMGRQIEVAPGVFFGPSPSSDLPTEAEPVAIG
jgi:hypothetical protein